MEQLLEQHWLSLPQVLPLAVQLKVDGSDGEACAEAEAADSTTTRADVRRTAMSFFMGHIYAKLAAAGVTPRYAPTRR